MGFMEKKVLEFGTECKDMITGVEGILTGRYVFLTGCDRYEITPKDATKTSAIFDMSRIEILDMGPNSLIDKFKAAGMNNASDLDTSKFELGDVLEESITKYTGTCTGKHICTDGDVSYSITMSKLSKDNTTMASWWDEGRLTLIKKSKEAEVVKENVKTSKRTGGVVPTYPCK